MASASGTPSFPLLIPVFVDSSLGTHHAMAVSFADTVANVKEKIRIEHALCFPNFGEIIVQSLKVRLRGSFYHLSDSMLVMSAFNGTKGTWFLHMDAVSASHQEETTKNVTKHPLLDMVHNSSPFPHTGSSYDHLVSDDANVDESNLMNLGAKGPCGDRSMPPTEHEKKLDPNGLESRMPVCEGDRAVESNGELVSTMKEKSRKRNNGAYNARLSDKDGFSTEKKKHKKGEDGPLVEPEDPVSNYGNCILHKEMSISENGHPESSTQHRDGPSQKDLTKDEKKKKRKRKKEASKLQSEFDFAIPETGPSDKSSNESDAVISLAKQVAEENPQEELINNHKKSVDETDAAFLLGKAARNVTGGDSLEVGDVPLNLEGSNCKGETTPKVRLPNHESGNEHTIQGPVIDADPQGTSDDKHADLNKTSDSVFTLQESAPQKNSAEEDSEVPINSHRSKKKSKSGSSRNVSSKHDSLHSSVDNHESGNGHTIQGPVTDADPQVTFDDKHADLNKTSDSVFTLQEAAPQKNSAEEDSVVPIKSHHSKKKSKSGSSRNVSSKHESLHSSVEHVNEENLEASGNEEIFRKESDVMSTIVEDVGHRSHAEGNPEVSSITGVKASRHSKRKKSDNTELLNPQTDNTYEIVRSSGDYVTEINLKETSDDQCKDPHEESKDSVVVEEAAVLGNHTVDDCVVPFNPNDRKARRRRKKSTKVELPNHDSINKEHVHSLVKETTKENSKETMEDSRTEQGEESKLSTITREAAVRENPALVDSTFPSNPNDRNSQRRKKKSASSTNHSFIGEEPIDSLVKQDTKENPIVTLEGSLKEQGNEAKLAIVLGEAATYENPAEANLANPTNNNKKRSRNNKNFFSKTDLDHSSGNLCPHENLEKALGTIHRDAGNENSGTAPNETVQNLVCENHIAADSSRRPSESSNNQDCVQQSTKEASEKNDEGLLGKSHESSAKETTEKERVAESIETNDHMELPKSDSDNINFVEFFVAKAAGLESHTSEQEQSCMGTESRKLDEEKTKRRKRNLNTHSEDSTHDLVNPSSLNKEHMLKKKPLDDDPGNHDLVNSLVQHTEDPKTKRRDHKKTGERRKYDLRATRSKADNNRLEEKPQVSNSDTHDQVSLSKDDRSKNLKGKISTVSKRKRRSIPYHEDNEFIDSGDGNQQPMNLDAKPATQNHSSAYANISVKETIADLAGSSDSTEEDTPSRKYRVSVRNSSRFGKNLSDVGQEKSLLAIPGTVFNDAISESSEDEFEEAVSKTMPDYSSLEETQKEANLKPHAYMNSRGVASDAYAENDRGTGDIILTQTSELKKSRPLAKILRSTSSYRKAKRTASQSQVDDSESQPIDIVPESQP